MNTVAILGNLATNPRDEVLPSGTIKTSFLLAYNLHYSDSNGDAQEKAQFFWVEAYGRQAVNASKYLVKGQQVAVQGSLDSGVIRKEDAYKNCTCIRASNIQYLSKPKAIAEQENLKAEAVF